MWVAEGLVWSGASTFRALGSGDGRVGEGGGGGRGEGARHFFVANVARMALTNAV